MHDDGTACFFWIHQAKDVIPEPYEARHLSKIVLSRINRDHVYDGERYGIYIVCLI